MKTVLDIGDIQPRAIDMVRVATPGRKRHIVA